MKFYIVRKYSEKELELLNIQIGCVLRHVRLKKDLSQHQLSLLLGTNPTMVGRVERFENVSGWDKIYLICQHLEIDFLSLFNLKSKAELLSIVEESIKLDTRLTKEKKAFYVNLKKEINFKFNNL